MGASGEAGAAHGPTSCTLTSARGSLGPRSDTRQCSTWGRPSTVVRQTVRSGAGRLFLGTGLLDADGLGGRLPYQVPLLLGLLERRVHDALELDDLGAAHAGGGGDNHLQVGHNGSRGGGEGVFDERPSQALAP